MKKKTGISTEPWYMSRRVWACVLTLLATVSIVLMPDQYEIWKAAGTAVATILGLTSWTFPKA